MSRQAPPRLLSGMGNAAAGVAHRWGERGSGNGAAIGHATGTRPETSIVKIS